MITFIIQKDEVLRFEPSTVHSYAYHAILPLKLILLKQLNPDQFGLMDRLMDHNDHRIKVGKNYPWFSCPIFAYA